jgi:hypothetical protein
MSFRSRGFNRGRGRGKRITVSSANWWTAYTQTVLPGLPIDGPGCDMLDWSGASIINVTNVNASGAGSLKDAITTTGDRIIIPCVSGIINDIGNARWTPGSGKCLYMGWLAPGPLAVLGSGINYGTAERNHILTDLPCFLGDDDATPTPDSADTWRFPGGGVLLRCLGMWGIDGTADAVNAWVGNSSFIDCIFAESLVQSLHSEGGHSRCCLLSPMNATIDPVPRALLARVWFHSSTSRNPLIDQSGKYDIINCLSHNGGNVHYNVGVRAPTGPADPDKPVSVNFVQCVASEGPNENSQAGIFVSGQIDNMTVPGNVYHTGFRLVGNVGDPVGRIIRDDTSPSVVSTVTPAHTITTMTILPSISVLNDITNNGGPCPLDRAGWAEVGDVIERLATEAQSTGGSLVDRVSTDDTEDTPPGTARSINAFNDYQALKTLAGSGVLAGSATFHSDQGDYPADPIETQSDGYPAIVHYALERLPDLVDITRLELQ